MGSAQIRERVASHRDEPRRNAEGTGEGNDHARVRRGTEARIATGDEVEVVKNLEHPRLQADR